jgi:hypothetical protein
MVTRRLLQLQVSHLNSSRQKIRKDGESYDDPFYQKAKYFPNFPPGDCGLHFTGRVTAHN